MERSRVFTITGAAGFNVSSAEVWLWMTFNPTTVPVVALNTRQYPLDIVKLDRSFVLHSSLSIIPFHL